MCGCKKGNMTHSEDGWQPFASLLKLRLRRIEAQYIGVLLRSWENEHGVDCNARRGRN